MAVALSPTLIPQANALIGIEHPFYWKPLAEALIDRARRNAEAGGPLSNAHRYPLVREAVDIAAVLRLLSNAGPFAIIRGVVSLIVNSFESLAARPVAHVGKEVLEAHPSLTNTDAPAPVVSVTARVGIVAPPLHATPNTIDFGLTHFMGGCPFAYSLSTGETSARNVVTTAEQLALNGASVPTVASAEPLSRISECPVEVAHRCEPSEPQAWRKFRNAFSSHGRDCIANEYGMQRELPRWL